MYRNVPHAATSVNYTSEFRESFEATKYNKRQNYSSARVRWQEKLIPSSLQSFIPYSYLLTHSMEQSPS